MTTLFCGTCGARLLFSCRARGTGICGPCTRSRTRVDLQERLDKEIALARAAEVGSHEATWCWRAVALTRRQIDQILREFPADAP